MSTAKINDWNLYGSSLGVVNFFQASLQEAPARGAVTIALGIAGTVLSAVGIMTHFTDFLTVLGVAISRPPAASSSPPSTAVRAGCASRSIDDPEAGTPPTIRLHSGCRCPRRHLGRGLLRRQVLRRQASRP